jgi:hypothetical protein
LNLEAKEYSMSVIPQAALTTVQIVSGLAASAKNAVDLAKASSNNELKGAVSELYDSVLDVKGRVLELDEEDAACPERRNRRVGCKVRILLLQEQTE